MYIIVALVILSGCRSSKVVKSSTEVEGARSSDSTAVSFVQVDSASWSATNDSSVTSSTHYEVLRDSVGQPVLDSIGSPMTYIVQRDTIWRVVNISKGASSQIIERDTVQIVRVDTIFIHKSVLSKEKTNKGSTGFGLILELLTFFAFIGMIMCVILKFKKKRSS